MAGMYAVYHGPKGLKDIATRIHNYTKTVAQTLGAYGFEQLNEVYFDTIKFKVENLRAIRTISESKGINLNYIDDDTVSISLNEAFTKKDIRPLVNCFVESQALEDDGSISEYEGKIITGALERKSAFLEHETFNSYHSETDLMRYIKKLERKDLALNHSMISLGSCTMKLNAASEMLPLSWANWGNIHPYVPVIQAEGYQLVLKELEEQLNVITGFAATSLQPNSGAQGEYAGLMTIRAYHQSRGEGHRDICIIPASAHGTNPASAAMSR